MSPWLNAPNFQSLARLITSTFAEADRRRAACLTDLEALTTTPSDRDQEENFNCHVCRVDTHMTGPRCRHCALAERLSEYESAMFFFKYQERKGAGRTAMQENDKKDILASLEMAAPTWKTGKSAGAYDVDATSSLRRSSLAIYALDTLLAYAKRSLSAQQNNNHMSTAVQLSRALIDRGQRDLAARKAREKEFNQMRVFWRAHYDLLSELDSVRMAKISVALAEDQAHLDSLSPEIRNAHVLPSRLAVDDRIREAVNELAAATHSRRTLRSKFRHLLNRVDDNSRADDHSNTAPYDDLAPRVDALLNARRLSVFTQPSVSELTPSHSSSCRAEKSNEDLFSPVAILDEEDKDDEEKEERALHDDDDEEVSLKKSPTAEAAIEQKKHDDDGDGDHVMMSTTTVEKKDVSSIVKISEELAEGEKESSFPLEAKAFEASCCPEVRECAVCLHRMTVERGVLSNCGHEFCGQCVRDAATAAGGSGLRCPTCRSWHQLSEVCFTLALKSAASKQVRTYGTKVSALVADVAELPKGDKALVFAEWETMLDVVVEALKAAGVTFERLTGKSGKQWDESLDRFRRSPEVTALVLNVQTAGAGLTLVEANHVFLLHPLLSRADEAQAIGRVHRIGQTKPVTVRRFLINDTVEIELFKAAAARGAHATFAEDPESPPTKRPQATPLTAPPSAGSYVNRAAAQALRSREDLRHIFALAADDLRQAEADLQHDANDPLSSSKVI